MITTLLLAQLSLFCGTRDHSFRVWSHPESYNFRAHTRAGLPEMIERQTISVNWPRSACTRTEETFLTCAGEGENGPTHEAPVLARNLVVKQEGDSFVVELEANGVKRVFRREGACKLREESF